MARKRGRKNGAGSNSQEAQNSVQEVGPGPGDDRDELERICGSLVKIVCYQPQQKPGEMDSVITGVILTSGTNFCHIIALWDDRIYGDESINWTFEVILPDGTKMNLPKEDLQVKGIMVAFTLRTSTKMNPVQISEEKISKNDPVFAVGFSRDLARPYIICYRSPGLITYAREDQFHHDCPPCLETYSGGPIFNKQDQFVGITYRDQGIAVALSISTITKFLAEFHDDMKDQPLSIILQCIKDKAELPKKKKSRKKSRKTK